MKKRAKENLGSFLIVIGFLVVLCFLLFRGEFKKDTLDIPFSKDVKQVQVGNTIINIEIADTLTKRTQGLSGRKSLGEKEGMFFVFEEPDKYSFWMKDMNFPLDIIWIGEDYKIVYIKKNVKPDSYPESYTPPEDAKYILEVVAGFSNKHSVAVGQKVSFLK